MSAVAERDEAPVQGRSNRQLVFARLRHDVAAVVSGVIIVLLLLGATVGAPLAAHLTGHAPNATYSNAVSIRGVPVGVMERPYRNDGVHRNPKAALFPLGADTLGRDILVRVLYGARISLIVAFGATGLSLLVGIVLGLLAGYVGGWVDAVINRVTETAMAFPSLLLAVGLAVVVGGGLINVLVVIALFSWFYPARIVRSVTLTGKHRLYVQAARTMGARPRRLLIGTSSRRRRRRCSSSGRRSSRTTSSSRRGCRISASACRRPRRAGARCCRTR